MSRIRARLTYANVVSSLCLFLVLGGGSAWAAHEVIDGSDIVDNSVGTADLKDADVRNVDLRPNSIGSTRVGNNSLLGVDIDESTLQGLIRHSSGNDQLNASGEFMNATVAESLPLAAGLTIKSTGSGDFQICGGPSATLIPYVQYLNGTRSTGLLTPTINTQDCDNFDPGAGGDFVFHAGRNFVEGSPTSGTAEAYLVKALSG